MQSTQNIIEQTAITFEYVVPSIEEFRGQDQAYIGAISIPDSGKGWKNRRLCLCQSVQKRERHMTGQWRHPFYVDMEQKRSGIGRKAL